MFNDEHVAYSSFDSVSKDNNAVPYIFFFKRADFVDTHEGKKELYVIKTQTIFFQIKGKLQETEDHSTMAESELEVLKERFQNLEEENPSTRAEELTKKIENLQLLLEDTSDQCEEAFKEPSNEQLEKADGPFMYRIARCYQKLSSKWTPDNLKKVYERGRDPETNTVHCYMCGRQLQEDSHKCKCLNLTNCQCNSWQMEHILCKSSDLQHNHVLENLLPACCRCNSMAWKGNQSLLDCVTKKGMHIEEWALNIAGLGTEARIQLQAAFNLQNRDTQNSKYEYFISFSISVFIVSTKLPQTTIKEEELSNFSEIGSGASAIVFKALWNGSFVAVKHYENWCLNSRVCLLIQREFDCLRYS